MSRVGYAIVSLMAALAAFDGAEWAYRAPIALPEGAGEFVRAPLTEDVVDKAQPGLSDLRVVGPEASLLRHLFARTAPADGETVWRAATQLNKTYVEGAYARVTLDFGGRVLKDRVRVDVPGMNYRRYAELEGSQDGATWETVATEWLFRIVEPTREFRSETFAFPENDFQYLRLTVHNMDDERGRVEIGEVEWSDYREPQRPETFPVPVMVTRLQGDDIPNDQTIFELDTHWRNLPLQSLSFTVGNGLFHRGVEIYGRNAQTQSVERRTDVGLDTREIEAPWAFVRADVIYRMLHEGEIRERLAIENLHAPYRYLQVRIHNGDSPSVALDENGFALTRLTLPEVVFETGGAAEVSLYYGNPKAAMADYDLREALGGLDTATLAEAAVGEGIEMAPTEPALPLTERYEFVLWGALILAVVAALALIAWNLGKMAPE